MPDSSSTSSGSGTSLRKRQQIENTGKTMFMWVAIASAIVAIAAVLSTSIVERLLFNQEIISKKGETAANLKSNIAIVDELRASVQERNTDQALLDTKRLEEAEPLSVVLDALPSQPNVDALGASLKQRLLNVPGVQIDSLDPGTQSADDMTGSAGESKMPFSFKVSASNADAIVNVLRNLERSIRVFEPEQVVIEQQANTLTLSVTGVAYYAPEVKVELEEKSISPHGTKKSTKQAGGKS